MFLDVKQIYIESRYTSSPMYDVNYLDMNKANHFAISTCGGCFDERHFEFEIEEEHYCQASF